jgi:membrane associated rhomboid family serine protease
MGYVFGGTEARRFPIATLSVVLANVVVYLLTSSENLLTATASRYVYRYGFIPALLLSYEGLARIFTSMFIHADFFHIFFNMYFLYIFGRGVEDILGSVRFLTLYFLSGIGAALFHTASTPVVGLESIAIPAVGASGAISGILGAYMMFFPRTSLVACFPILFFPVCYTLRASAYLALWFATQVVYGYMKIGGVAFFAHAGGFIAGIALAWVLGSGKVRELKVVRSFMGVFRYIVFQVYNEGLGFFTKAVLVFLMALTAATLGYYASSLGAPTVMVYQGYLRVDGVDDIVLLKVSANGSYSLSESQYTDVNIVLTRLSKVGFLVNQNYSGRTIDTTQKPLQGTVTLRISLAGYLEIAETVPVAVYARASYDGAGVLVRAEGTMVTQVVIVRAYRVDKSPATYTFSYNAIGPYETEPVRVAAIPSVAIALVSTYVTTKKDKELSVA